MPNTTGKKQPHSAHSELQSPPGLVIPLGTDRQKGFASVRSELQRVMQLMCDLRQ